MFNFLFNPNGRVSRIDMWLKYLLPYIALTIVARIADHVLPVSITAGFHHWHGPVSTLLGLFYLWPSIAVPVKRFHDRGMSGWWLLIFVLLWIGGFVAVALSLPWHQLMSVHTHEEMRAVFQAIPPDKGIYFLAGGLEVLIVSLVYFVMQYLLGGQSGENKYGPDPRAGG